MSDRKSRATFRVAWRVAAFVAAGLLAGGAVVAFGFGRCHDSGGFCADEFGATHVEAYASAAVLAALAALATVVPFSRRPVRLTAVALVAAGLVVAAAVGAESGT